MVDSSYHSDSAYPPAWTLRAILDFPRDLNLLLFCLIFGIFDVISFHCWDGGIGRRDSLRGQAGKVATCSRGTGCFLYMPKNMLKTPVCLFLSACAPLYLYYT